MEFHIYLYTSIFNFNKPPLVFSYWVENESWVGGSPWPFEAFRGKLGPGIFRDPRAPGQRKLTQEIVGSTEDSQTLTHGL